MRRLALFLFLAAVAAAASLPESIDRLLGLSPAARTAFWGIQIVDVATNPRGPEFLERDCRNITRWFASRGYPVDADELFGDLMAEAVSSW